MFDYSNQSATSQIFCPDNSLPKTVFSFKLPPLFAQQAYVHFPDVLDTQSTFLLIFAHNIPFDQMILLFQAVALP